MDKCLKSDFTFQMASSLPSTTLRKNMERSGVSSAVPHYLTTNDIMTGKASLSCHRFPSFATPV